jgi:uncharacterized cupin superfamily protein
MNAKANSLRAKLIRNPRDAQLDLEQRDPHYETRCGRLAVGTAARGLGASFDIVPPGKRACPYHFHRAQEELFVVLRGEGTLRVDGELLPVVAGDLIFIPPGPEYAHQLINTSSAPLEYLSISTKSEVEIVEYPDSAKLLARAIGVHHMTRAGDAVDYWEGEP